MLGDALGGPLGSFSIIAVYPLDASRVSALHFLKPYQPIAFVR